MAKVHYNRLSQYAGENGGRVLLLFLLFLLSIYSLINSGIMGMAAIAMLPLIIIFIYLAFSYRMFTFWLLFFLNYFLMLINREGYLPVPVSLPNELLELILIAIAIVDLRESNFENLANIMTLGIVGWCAFCVLEVLNDTCGLGININAWFNGIRLLAFLLLYIVIVFALYITTPKRLYQLIFSWACLCVFADYWSWQQQYIGFTQAESAWLYGYAYRTHLVNGITRYWSIFSDAASFGVHMAAASTAFFIIAITNKVKKFKIFFLIVGLLSTWQMFASGTRTSIYCMMAGFAVFLFLSKSIKIIVPVCITFGLFLCMLIFTDIGQGNAQIRRMRSGFNKNDASANVREINKAAIAKYMKDAPWGIGIGIYTENIPAWNKFKLLSEIPPDSEYVFIWVRTGRIGVTWFALMNALVLVGACWIIFFKLKNRSLMGIGSAWCAAFAAMHLGGYANQILLQYPNALVFYGGLTTVYLYPKMEQDFIEYENKLLEKEAEKKRLKLEKKLAKRV